MKTERIDLYEYFGVERPLGGQGYLTCYTLNNTEEACSARKHPAMLVIAGGGYVQISDREKEPVALKYLANDFNAFILDYACHPLTYPQAFKEAAMAMAYIKINADKYNVIKDKVVAIGFSAGGHLLGCIATMFKSKELNFLGKFKSLVRPDASLFIYPVVSGVEKGHYGSFFHLLGKEDKEMFESLSIENNVDVDSSPAFIASTYGDNIVPIKNSLLLANAYEEKGVPFTLHIFERGDHGLSVCDKSVYNKDLYQEKVEKAGAQNFKDWVKLSLDWLVERGFTSVDD